MSDAKQEAGRLVAVVQGEPSALTVFIAKQVRSAMEGFHIEHLSDEQMAVLNPIIRNAIYRALLIRDVAREGNGDERVGAMAEIAYSGPDHAWEPPTLGDEDLARNVQ